MNLRKLEMKDAQFMLEWMHDDYVVHNMGTNFLSKTIEDCDNFIKNSIETQDDLHLAIVNEEDEYMGTVSLKHITPVSKCAEFAITVRKKAMGQGYAQFAMKEIIRIGFEKLKLRKIYWCVSELNKRAVRFYDKNGYKRIYEAPEELKKYYSPDIIDEYMWYEVDNNYMN